MSPRTPSRSAPSRLGLLLLLSLAPSQVAMMCGPGYPDPCEDDALGCDDGLDDFALDPACELQGALEVEVGTGSGEGFEAFAAAAGPKVHFGDQGGQHIFLSVRVGGVDLDRYEVLKLGIELRGETTPWEVEDDKGCPWRSHLIDDGTCDTLFGERELVLGVKKSMATDTAGRVVADDLLIVLAYWPPESELSLTVSALDPCGQEGLVAHSFSVDVE